MNKLVVRRSALLPLLMSTLLAACGSESARDNAATPIPVPVPVPVPAVAARTVVLLPPAMAPALVEPSESNPGSPMPPAPPETRLVPVVPVPPAPKPPVSVVTTPKPPPVLVAPPAPKPPASGATAPPPVVAAPAPPKSLDKPPAFTFVTDVTVDSTKSAEQLRVPITFGQVFAPGDVTSSHSLKASLADGTAIALQVDAKARHADGSLRHAVLSTTLPRLAAHGSQKIYLSATPAAAPATALRLVSLLDAGFSASIQVDIDGQRYSASADALLADGRPQTWLAGPVAGEWLVSSPLLNAQGVEHDHLSARFAVRAYGNKQARVDVTVENSWAFEGPPRNYVYNATISVGGKEVYAKTALTHYHHARWRKVFWWGAEPAVSIRHNVDYLIDSRALPNIDRRIVANEGRLATWKTIWTGPKTEPMGIGLAVPYMPATGGRDDIGLLPAWAALYLISMDPRAKEVTLGTATLAGSWSAHYRDKRTDRPVSLNDYPYMTVFGQRNDTFNPTTKKLESFPTCSKSSACATPYTHDTSHQPNFAYLPYVVTGDHYYLEELQFWAMWSAFSSNPGYRDNVKGLVKSDQVRGQAWTLRAIGEASYISPDADVLKAHFTRILNANLDWFNESYSNNAAANKLGALTNGYALAYSGGTGLAPWQDDFFTSTVGHLDEMGFTKAKPLLLWKSRFVIERMLATDTCWLNAASYTLLVRSSASGPFFDSMKEAWRATQGSTLSALVCNSGAMQTALNVKAGEMTGYSNAATGYPSIMQSALAYAAQSDKARGMAAWDKFMRRSVKPDYTLGPQFALVPRQD